MGKQGGFGFGEDEKPKKRGYVGRWKKKWLAEDVERIYEAYPRHVARGSALPAIIKALYSLVCPKPVEWLLARVEAFGRSDTGRGGFCPHCSTWMNQERYFDDDEQWKDRKANDGGRPTPVYRESFLGECLKDVKSDEQALQLASYHTEDQVRALARSAESLEARRLFRLVIERRAWRQ